MHQAQTAYEVDILQKRQQRAAMLLEDRSWFNLAGLYWLQTGSNHVGSLETNNMILPDEAAPAYVGVFQFQAETVSFVAAPGVTVTANGKPIAAIEMQPDTSSAPDFLTLGNLTMLLIKRGERYGIRLWNKANPARQEFSGLRWYAIDPRYCLTADFVPYASPKPISFTDVLGDVHTVASPGYVRFSWQGADYCLDAQQRGERLFFNFGDATNGDATYPAGRFLFADTAQQGKVTLDFNQATNPFCAYTPYATCPLPPAQNRLPIRIEAGEMNYTG